MAAIVTDGDCSPNILAPEIVDALINLTISTGNFDDLESRVIKSRIVENSYTIVITRKEQYFFPLLPKPRKPFNNENGDIIGGGDTSEESDEDSNQMKLENCESNSEVSKAESSELNVVVRPFRVVISGSTLKASFQVFGVEKDCITNAIRWNGSAWQVSEELLRLFNFVSYVGCFRVCEGFTNEELSNDDGSPLKSFRLVTNTTPFLRYESPNCSHIINPLQWRTTTKCQECVAFLSGLKCYKKRRAINKAKAGPSKLPKTDVSSKTKISILSPRSTKKRLTALRLDRTNLRKKCETLQKRIEEAKMKLNDSHSET